MRTFIFAASLVTLSCGDATPADGTLGGPCRLSTKPCNQGLVCDNGCRKAEDAVDAERVDLMWDMRDRAVLADGESSLVVGVTLLDRNSGEPLIEELLVWVEPEGSGTVEPSRVEPDQDGRALFRFLACDSVADDCGAHAVVKVARADAPLKVIGASPAIELEGGREGPGGDLGAPAELVSSCGTGWVKVTRGSEVLLDAKLTESHWASGCVGGCGRWMVGKAGDNGPQLSVMVARSNSEERPSLGCQRAGAPRSGVFPIPRDVGTWTSLWGCDSVDDFGEGSGTGTSRQAMVCDGARERAFYATVDAECPEQAAPSAEPVRIRGCVAWKAD
jgi:hypothetical protein